MALTILQAMKLQMQMGQFNLHDLVISVQEVDGNWYFVISDW